MQDDVSLYILHMFKVLFRDQYGFEIYNKSIFSAVAIKVLFSYSYICPCRPYRKSIPDTLPLSVWFNAPWVKISADDILKYFSYYEYNPALKSGVILDLPYPSVIPSFHDSVIP